MNRNSFIRSALSLLVGAAVAVKGITYAPPATDFRIWYTSLQFTIEGSHVNPDGTVVIDRMRYDGASLLRRPCKPVGFILPDEGDVVGEREPLRKREGGRV